MQKKQKRPQQKSPKLEAGSLKKKINKIDKPDSSRNKGSKIKSTKIEMKMEKSQQTTQKYKGS